MKKYYSNQFQTWSKAFFELTRLNSFWQSTKFPFTFLSLLTHFGWNYLFAYLQIALSQLDKTSKSSKKFETCGNPFVRVRWSNCITVVVRYGFIFAKIRSIHFFSIQVWSWVGSSKKYCWRWWRSTTCWNSVSLRCAWLKLSSHWP